LKYVVVLSFTFGSTNYAEIQPSKDEFEK